METETGLLVGLIVLLILVFLTIVGLLIQSGLITPIDIKACKPSFGDLTIAYKFACGPYKESGSLFTQCHTLLPDYKTVGVYYDDPKKKAPHKLRYIVGLILSENKETLVKEEDKKILEENGFKFATFPSIDHAVFTTFPFNSTISIIIAVMRVYPALTEYIETRSLCAHPFLEIYDNTKSEIMFMGPLVRQHDFYVPEVKEDDEDRFDDDDTITERSWDESASFINSDDLDKSESNVEDDSSVSRTTNNDFEGFKVPVAPAAHNTPTPSTTSTQTNQSEETRKAEDSDANTASSFEEIDEKEVAAVSLDPLSTSPDKDTTAAASGAEPPKVEGAEDEAER